MFGYGFALELHVNKSKVLGFIGHRSCNILPEICDTDSIVKIQGRFMRVLPRMVNFINVEIS